MINYDKLFNVLYSDEISEEVKARVIEKLSTELDESMEACSPYVEYINTLINSNITEASLSDVLDTTFGKLSEAEINTITKEFIKSAVNSYIQEGFGTPRPIGLTGIRKELNKQNEPKAQKSSAMDKLKSAAGKVKSWVDKVREINKPSTLAGINKMQAKKDEQLKKYAEAGTEPKKEHKPEEPKSDDTPQPPAYRTEVHGEPEEKVETPSATTPKTSKHLPRKERLEELRNKFKTSKQEEQKENENPFADPVLKAVRRREDKEKKDKEKEKKAEKNSISAALDTAFKPKAEVKTEEPKVEKVETSSTEKKSSKKNAPKTTTKVESEKKTTKKTTAKKTTTKKTTTKKAAAKKTTTKKVDTVAKSVANAASSKTSGKKSTKKQTVKVSRKPKNTDEALADTLCLLANTNISESTLDSIVEMMSNAKLAKKAVEKEENDFNNAANALNHEVEMSAKTGMPVNPEIVKKAEKQAERYEHFKTLADKKFGS